LWLVQVAVLAAFLHRLPALLHAAWYSVALGENAAGHGESHLVKTSIPQDAACACIA
jgi:hypothetical protein